MGQICDKSLVRKTDQKIFYGIFGSLKIDFMYGQNTIYNPSSLIYVVTSIKIKK